MVDFTLLILFIPTFFVVSFSPGMCMMLAMTLGMSFGFRLTLWMMWGELLGIAIMAIAAVVGVSAIMLESPMIFRVLKLLGAVYLLYVGVKMWRSKGDLRLKMQTSDGNSISKAHLFKQGFVTAVSNPKGWAFMISILPPFINPELPLTFQLSLLVIVILITEFICMTLYASGGNFIGKILVRDNNVKLLNKISGTMMMLVAIFLVIP